MLIQINVGRFDVHKHRAIPLQADCKVALEALTNQLPNWQSCSDWSSEFSQLKNQWDNVYEQVTNDDKRDLPSDAQVLGAVKRQSSAKEVVVCAAGGLPGELHKLWRCEDSKSYHVEYGFSCMGYEIAGGLGVKMASPEREVFVVVGDGSYMMMNSELATSVMMGQKIIVIVLDNRGYGCINRLQMSTGNKPFNNLLDDCHTIDEGAPKLDFANHAKAMGAKAESVASIVELEAAIVRAKQSERSYLISIDTDPYTTTDNGDSWWDVAIPEVSKNDDIKAALQTYQTKKHDQPY